MFEFSADAYSHIQYSKDSAASPSHSDIYTLKRRQAL